MSLPGDLVQRLETALLDAFPDDDSLDQLIRRVGMQTRIPARAALDARIGKLVEIVAAQGRVLDLLHTASELAPGNVVLAQARPAIIAELHAAQDFAPTPMQRRRAAGPLSPVDKDVDGVELVVLSGADLTEEESYRLSSFLRRPLARKDPSCHAHLVESDDCVVQWLDEDKSYHVFLKGEYNGDARRLGSLAQRIADLSRCESCGRRPIRLLGNRLARQGARYVLSAEYRCYRCESKRASPFVRILNTLGIHRAGISSVAKTARSELAAAETSLPLASPLVNPIRAHAYELGRLTADLVVLTVLPEEYAAVRACLRDPALIRGSAAAPNTCAWQLGFVDADPYAASFKVVLGMGTSTTVFGALAASEAIALFDPRYVAFVGVAGGFDREGQRHGDVAVSSEVTAYEYGKVDTGGFAPRGNFTYRCNEALVRATNAARATGARWWRDEDNPTGPPSVRIGMIASGDKVIDDPDEAFFAAVRAAWPKLLAVEMEGAGVAAAVHEVQGHRAVGFILVRGISDMPHHKALGESASTQERDRWKVTASRNGARFLKYLVATAWPIPPRDTCDGTSDPTAAETVQTTDCGVGGGARGEGGRGGRSGSGGDGTASGGDSGSGGSVGGGGGGRASDDGGSALQPWEKIATFVTGVIFLLLLFYVGARSEPIQSERQFFFLRLIAALMAAAFAGSLGGFLRVVIHGKGFLVVRAGGALAAFAVVYLLNPPGLVDGKAQDIAEPPPSTTHRPTVPSASGSAIAPIDAVQGAAAFDVEKGSVSGPLKLLREFWLTRANKHTTRSQSPLTSMWLQRRWMQARTSAGLLSRR